MIRHASLFFCLLHFSLTPFLWCGAFPIRFYDPIILEGLFSINADLVEFTGLTAEDLCLSSDKIKNLIASQLKAIGINSDKKDPKAFATIRITSVKHSVNLTTAYIDFEISETAKIDRNGRPDLCSIWGKSVLLLSIGKSQDLGCKIILSIHEWLNEFSSLHLEANSKKHMLKRKTKI